MIQFGQSLCFSPETIAEPLLAGLDGNIAPESRIASLPDFSHSPCAETG
jgi:hypothetical protein